MSIKETLTEKWDVNLLGNDLSGINEIYREIADEIGIEKTFVIFNLFHGTQVSFPNRLFSKEYIHKATGDKRTVPLSPRTVPLSPCKL